MAARRGGFTDRGHSARFVWAAAWMMMLKCLWRMELWHKPRCAGQFPDAEVTSRAVLLSNSPGASTRPTNPSGGKSVEPKHTTRLGNRKHEVPPETTDIIFPWLAKALPSQWGEVLDAGTGPDSLRWLASCPVSRITAVTACAGMYATVEDEVSRYLDMTMDRIIVGNWQDNTFLGNSSFDVVVADYLLGSVEFFVGHFQLGLVRRLHKLVRPGGWLALVGKEPNDLMSADPTSRLLLDIDALRDAAMVLSQQRPYREMPLSWVEEELRRVGFLIIKQKVFPKRIDVEKARLQLAWAAEEIERVVHDPLRSALRQQLKALRSRIEVSTPLRRGHTMGLDYGIVAQRSGE